MCCQIKSTELYWSAFHLIVLWYLMQWLSFNLKKYYIVAFDCFVLPLHFIFKGQVGIKGRGQKDFRVRKGQGWGQKHSWWCSVQRNHYSLSAAALPDKTQQTDGWQQQANIWDSRTHKMQLKTRTDVDFWIYPTHIVQIVIFRERGTWLVWAWIDPRPFGQCQIEYFCTGGRSLWALCLCCVVT